MINVTDHYSNSVHLVSEFTIFLCSSLAIHCLRVKKLQTRAYLRKIFLCFLFLKCFCYLIVEWVSQSIIDLPDTPINIQYFCNEKSRDHRVYLKLE